MKAILKKILPPMLVQTIQRVKTDLLGVHSVKSYAQEGEDLILRRFFNEKAEGFYIDVGAYHPKRFSNTFWFYKRGWHGMNVEPNPEAARLFARYRKRDINVNAGVSDEEGKLTYFMFNEPALNTFDCRLAEKHQSEKYWVIETRDIKVRRLESILREYLPACAQIDFLSVDVEGFDLRVLKSNDWNTYRPICVLVEVLDLVLDDLDSCAVHGYLAKRGYNLFAKTFNTLFYQDLEVVSR